MPSSNEFTLIAAEASTLADRKHARPTDHGHRPNPMGPYDSKLPNMSPYQEGENKELRL